MTAHPTLQFALATEHLAAQVYEGTTEVQKLMIARALLEG